MKLLLPIAYLPPVSYFALMIKASEVLIECDETFQKQTLRNRCLITTAEGEHRLGIPLHGRRNNDKTTAIKLSSEQWREQHLKTIRTAYGSSPYFIYYFDFLQTLIMNDDTFLFNYDLKLIKALLKKLKLNIDIKMNQDFIPDHQLDESTVSLRDYPKFCIPRYTQVFEERIGFRNDMSVIDLIFNLGPSSTDYLKNLSENITLSK